MNPKTVGMWFSKCKHSSMHIAASFYAIGESIENVMNISPAINANVYKLIPPVRNERLAALRAADCYKIICEAHVRLGFKE